METDAFDVKSALAELMRAEKTRQQVAAARKAAAGPTRSESRPMEPTPSGIDVNASPSTSHLQQVKQAAGFTSVEEQMVVLLRKLNGAKSGHALLHAPLRAGHRPAAGSRPKRRPHGAR